jgi:aminoglycoside phosphotransferase (APT) family kinase protein
MKQPQLAAALTNAWRRQQGTELQVGSIERLSAGASAQTWRVSAVTEEGAQGLIVQLFSGQEQFTGALTRAEQGRVQQAACLAGVPTPEVLLVVGPEDGLNDGFVSRYTPGETLGKRIANDLRFSSARLHLTEQCARVLSQIHALPVKEFQELRHRPARTQLEELIRFHRSIGDALPAFELAFKWLAAHLPPAAPPRVVHGDFRNGNLIVDEEGLVAVLDWEMAHLGDPLEDLAWLCLRPWRFGQGDRVVGGFGERAELYESYVRCGGEKPQTAVVRFWEVFGTLKWGVICQWFGRQFLTGEVRVLERAAIGRRTSEAELDLIELIEGYDE